MADSKTQVVGSVFEGEDTCYVLFRLETLINNIPYKTTDVISMAKTPGGWGILMKADINLLIESLKPKTAGEALKKKSEM